MNFNLLKSILSQPSAPYREEHVIRVITQELKTQHVPYFLDPIGNIIIGAESKKDYFKIIKHCTREPLRIFIAHMDHPGFHGIRWLTRTRLAIQWHGGSPTRHLTGARVWLAGKKGWLGEGMLTSVKLHPSGRAIDRAMIKTVLKSSNVTPKHSLPLVIKAKEIFGGLQFRTTSWKQGKLLYTKAADDLVGTFAITSLAIQLFNKKSTSSLPFIGLLTRAEEVGFIGAIGHFEQGWLKKPKRPLLCISLETSRTLPGAEIGKGPVIRLGDKFTTFDPAALQVFIKIAQKTIPGRHQKRVMDGGTCEGTPAMVYGFPTIGISIPLGNYHNQSFEGGPDSAGPHGPAPEFVHLQDIEGMITLCHALMKPGLDWSHPWQEKQKEFRKSLSKARKLLHPPAPTRLGQTSQNRRWKEPSPKVREPP